MLNRLLESERIEAVCDKNGITIPTSALSLRMDAARKNADHSGILQRKIQNATGKKKPFGTRLITSLLGTISGQRSRASCYLCGESRSTMPTIASSCDKWQMTIFAA